MATIVKRILSSTIFGELNDEELQGFEWIKLKGEVSTRDYSTHFDYGYKKAQRHLAKMVKHGLIGDNGAAKTSPNYRYVAIEGD